MAKRAQVSRPQGRSVHIGLNSVNPGDYSGWDGPLTACEFDARDMQALARGRRMKAVTLLTADATRERVLQEIRDAAKALRRGDFFFLTYSGHGGQVDDVTADEDDRQDETWCLFDGELIDDELYVELGRFRAGVRLLVLSDSCHSGTVVRVGPPRAAAPRAERARSRLMPPEVARRVYLAHKKFYDGLQRAITKEAGKHPVLEPRSGSPGAAVSKRLMAVARGFRGALILISGCQDRQESRDGDRNGAFTAKLLEVWNKGRFRGNYAQFHAAIAAGMPGDQTPNLFTLGNAAAFVSERPWKV